MTATDERRMGEDVGDQVAVTGEDVEHAVGQAGLLVEAGDDQRRGGCRGCGLQDEDLAASLTVASGRVYPEIIAA